LSKITGSVLCAGSSRDHGEISKSSGPTTGRQPPPLSSVLYGKISERHSVLAAQLLLREKSGA
jgi:hypothetical protein